MDSAGRMFNEKNSIIMVLPSGIKATIEFNGLMAAGILLCSVNCEREVFSILPPS